VPLHQKCSWVTEHATGKWFVDLFKAAPQSPCSNVFLFERLNDEIITKMRWA
jgi:hypothetical protein